MNRIYIIIITTICFSLNAHAQWLWNREKLESIKADVKSLAYFNAYGLLIQQADTKLSEGTYSVTYKKSIAPNGNRHDYVSLSRYWWPNPDTNNHLPYIYKDGQSNPELNQYDRNSLGDMCNAVNTLALAYFYSEEERYATKAIELLRTWFLNKETKMNPNLNYSQFVPGRDGSKGRPEGLIDSYSFVAMLSSVQLLEGSANFTKQDKTDLQNWFAEFAYWLQTSPLGKKENEMKNNHATAYDSQLVTYLLFSKKIDEAKKIIEAFPEKRIFTQIEPDGKQPHELWRTLAYHYSEYNLSHMIDLFATAKRIGEELYKVESPDGRSFYKAMDYLISFLGKDVSEWPYKQISGWEAKQQDVCNNIYRILDLDSTRKDYSTIYKTYSKQDATDRNRLLYGTVDPIKEIFSFAGIQFDYAFTCIAEAMKEAQKKNLVSPRSIDKNGHLRMVNPRDWCSGFFPGSLWFMYEYTKDEKWKERANKHSMLIENEKFDRTSHDVGFKIFNSFGNGYRLTGSPEYKDVIVQAAKTLSLRFNKKIGSIRSWDFNQKEWQYPVIIDNMMNLELLFETTKMTGDSSFYQIADAHAMTTLKNHFREDYSSFHVVDYDSISGLPRLKQTHQGYADQSAWARGQAWAIYGFTMSYRYTRRTEYLQLAENITNFIFSHPNLPKDLIPYWDFNDPSIPNAPRDASTACIIASALYELSKYSETNSNKYKRWGDTIINNLISHYKSDPKTMYGFLLLHSTGHHPGGDEIDVPISYADYYFLEALLRRKNLNK
ncbi:alginate lyase family protein [Dysgonomonas sp. BGC7]|uniref:alginate lyase family protein n=1 Tax=Dysgonomonas sp. BGC7 TaxID=1658008 RepID=UPI000682CCD0|nr:alginate lyase family protein [Dysgonomonas sp. BGC7]MBD8387173.1 alginate lyase family protein [Dysgonomonas sp. BGC7]